MSDLGMKPLNFDNDKELRKMQEKLTAGGFGTPIRPVASVTPNPSPSPTESMTSPCEPNSDSFDRPTTLNVPSLMDRPKAPPNSPDSTRMEEESATEVPDGAPVKDLCGAAPCGPTAEKGRVLELTGNHKLELNFGKDGTRTLEISTQSVQAGK